MKIRLLHPLEHRLLQISFPPITDPLRFGIEEYGTNFRDLFFSWSGKPVLEIFGQYFDIFFLHDVVDDGRWYFEILHGLEGSLPELFCFGGCLGKVQVGNQFAELLEHQGVEVLVILRNYVFLIIRIFCHSRIIYINFLWLCTDKQL